MRKFLIPLVLALIAVTAWAQYGVVVWDPVEGADGYVVYKWDGAEIVPLAVVAGDTFFADMTVAEDDSTWYRVAAYAGVDTTENIGNLTSQFWAYADLAATVDTLLTVFAAGANIDTVWVDWTPNWMGLDFTATSLNVSEADSFLIYRGKYTDEVLGDWQLLGQSASPIADLDSIPSGARRWAEGDTLAYYVESFYSWGVDGYGVAVGDTVEVVAEAAAALYVPTHAYVKTGDFFTGSRNITVAIYAASDSSLVETSNTVAGTDSTTVEFEFTDASALDTEESYFVAFLAVGTWYETFEVATGYTDRRTGLSDIPDPMGGGAWFRSATRAVWVVNSEGSLLLGHSSDPDDYTATHGTNGGDLYWRTSAFSVESLGGE